MRPSPTPTTAGAGSPRFFVFSRLGGGASRAIQDREGLRTPLPNLGEQSGASSKEGSWPRPPGQLRPSLVFPGTLQQVPAPPRMPQPCFCQPLHGAVNWPDLCPSASATGKGGHCRRCQAPWGPLQGPAQDGCRVPGARGGGGLLAGLPAGVHAASGRPVCASARLTACLLCWDACRLATPMSQCWPGLTGLWPLGCCAGLSSDRMRTEEHVRGPQGGVGSPWPQLSLVPAHRF